MDRQVSNAELEAARLNPNNVNIIKSVTRQWSRVLSQEQQENCGLLALWKTLRKHDPNHPSRQKFTTSLWRFTKWECERAVRELSGPRRHRVQAEQIGELPCRQQPGEALEIRECVQSLPKNLRTLIHQYYFEKMTLEEVGEANGYSRETARALIRKAERALRRMLEGAV